ncbi:hypothetical protein AU198_14455 [Mycobacterium sp. GA-1199]|uniref:hypothetical protein n=1 Tax=Mycobacterium sp. GA-1199 TaxID=1772287 RepID=UPI00074A5857|nr:hypothetical protein [Mycobacterium sp. GA-1199]KUI44735.1 hypothetical protein AU198_14455 [Mycobacterium sp. GA-1199]
MQQRRDAWKVVTLGVALTGLGIAGAGVAGADGSAPNAAPESAAIGVEVPTADTTLLALDDSWDDSPDTSWDDSF